MCFFNIKNLLISHSVLLNLMLMQCKLLPGNSLFSFRGSKEMFAFSLLYVRYLYNYA